MEKYYIATWIFSLVFLGMFSLVMDMIYNREDEEEFIRPVTSRPRISNILDENEYIKDSFEDDVLENTEKNYFSDSDFGL
jgi:hypothetical protein